MKEFLHQNGFTYENRDMKKDDSLRDIIEAKYGTRKAPVVEVDNEVVIGGGQWTEENWKQLKELLQLQVQ
ncbi:glutaredoxin family protein [Ammoniphilus sp. CFH 90114]|uniref:glutaredoxin family protein n=1 Tax=Ammoniphilus sp. CFH 90114 TaxID=2493665 RepID=UPI00100E4EED|nr:glutaredoxin family protein [Ammoniphilus sp. CFH 90114]RXT06257.1 glutaredoxin family protein [Ammoniphilus sp. CFH 90114]